jgi:hypothetical protein
MRALSALPILLLGVACSSQNQIGVAEPFRVRAAAAKDPTPQFIKGELPGANPLDGGQTPPEPPDGAPPGPAEITVFGAPSVVIAGQAGVDTKGQTNIEGASVGVKLDVGSGYWAFPVQAPDLSTNNPAWEVLFDFGDALDEGDHTISAVAFDSNGNPGRRRDSTVCVSRNSPDNICFSSLAVPSAMISLAWDTPVDLDLQVLLPDGRLIDSKHPLVTEPNDAGVLPKRPDGIDRDSNPACNIDGINDEDLVWNITTPHGPYGIYVNLFSACNQQAVHFVVTAYKAIANKGGSGRHLAEQWHQGGELLALSANGGTQRGLYVNTFTFK